MAGNIQTQLRNVNPEWFIYMMGRAVCAGIEMARVGGGLNNPQFIVGELPAGATGRVRPTRTRTTTRTRTRTRAVAANGNIPTVPDTAKEGILTFAKSHPTWGLNPLAKNLGVSRTLAKRYADAMVGLGQLTRQGKAFKLAAAH